MEPEPYEKLWPSNSSVGRRIAMSTSGVCRLRMGNRLPSNEVMHRIEDAYDWPILDQFAAINRGTYAQDFDRMLKDESKSRAAA